MAPSRSRCRPAPHDPKMRDTLRVCHDRSMTDPTKPPAAWYDDGSGRLRYWDGENWTEHFAPLPETTAAPDETAAAEPTAAPEPALDDPTVGAEIPYGSAAYGEDAGEQPTAAYPTEVLVAPVEPVAPVNPAFAAPAPAPYGAPAPAPAYSAPQQAYGAPAQAYGAPPQQPYGAPGAYAAPGQPAYAAPGQPAYGAPGQPAYGASAAYGAAPYGAPAYAPVEPKKLNVLGIVALGIAVLGLIGVCIPFVTIVGLVLLVVAFVLSIVSLFLKGQKWPGFVGIAVSVVGAIIAGVVLLITLLTGLSDLGSDYSSDYDYGSDSDSGYESGDDYSLLESEATAPVAFGKTVEFDSGLEGVVEAPVPFTPSDSAFGADYAENFVVKITLTNTSDAPVSLETYTEMLAGGALGSQVFDSYEGTELGSASGETLAPGESLTWAEGWSVDSSDELVFYLEPMYDDDAAAFTR